MHLKQQVWDVEWFIITVHVSFDETLFLLAQNWFAFLEPLSNERQHLFFAGICLRRQNVSMHRSVIQMVSKCHFNAVSGFDDSRSQVFVTNDHN